MLVNNCDFIASGLKRPFAKSLILLYFSSDFEISVPDRADKADVYLFAITFFDIWK